MPPGPARYSISLQNPDILTRQSHVAGALPRVAECGAGTSVGLVVDVDELVQLELVQSMPSSQALILPSSAGAVGL